MGAKVYSIGFKLDGAVSSKFTGSMLNASKTVGVLGQKISHLEKSKAKADRFDALQKELHDTEKQFNEAEAESKQLAAALAVAQTSAQKLGNQFQSADRKTKKLGASVDSQKTAFAGLKHELASANQKVQKTNLAFSKAQKTSKQLATEIKATANPAKELKDRFAAAENETKRLSASLAAQKTSVAGLKHEMASANQTLQETKRAFSEAQKSSKQLSGEYKSASRNAKSLEGQLAAVTQKGDRLKTSVGKQKSSLSELEKELSSAGIKTGQLAKHNQELAKSIDRARGKQEKLQNIMMKRKAVKGKRSELQGKLFDAAAMAGTVAAPVMIAARFEQSMAEVKSLTGATGKDFQDLTAAARKLGSETSFSASEAAQGMKYLGMAGFDTKQIVSAMPGVLNMAKAGATELGTASDIASDILSGFGLEATDMTDVANVLTRTFTSSNTSLGMLGETMKYVAPVAAKAGMSLEETSAMAGLLGNVGVKASMAGTTLKSMVLGLASPSTKAKVALASLGVVTQDAEGNMRSFPNILGDIAEATQGMGNAEKLDIVGTIFGKEPASGITELLSQAGKEGIKEYVKKVREGTVTAKSIADTMDNTTIGAIKRFGSAAEGLAIVMGNTLTPVITVMANGLASVTRGVTAFSEKFPFATKVVGLLVGGTLALTAATVGAGYAFTFVSGGILKAREMYVLVGKSMKDVAKLTTNYNTVQKLTTIRTRIMTAATVGAGHAQKFLSAGLLRSQEMYRKYNISAKLATARTIAYNAMQKVSAVATQVMTAAQWGFNAAMSANPIGLAVMGVAALAAGAVALYRNFEPFKILVDNTWALIKSFGGGVWSGFMEGLQPVFSAFSEMKTAIGTVFSEIGVAISAVIAPFKGIFATLLAPVKAVFSTFLSPITEWFGALITPINESGKAMSAFAVAGRFVGKTFGLVIKTALFPLLTTIKAITFAARSVGKIVSFFTGKKKTDQQPAMGKVIPMPGIKVPEGKTAAKIRTAGVSAQAVKPATGKVIPMPGIKLSERKVPVQPVAGKISDGLKKGPGMPRLSPAALSQEKSVVIDYKPNINLTVPSGANSADVKEAVNQSLTESEARFRQMQENINHDDRRRALG